MLTATDIEAALCEALPADLHGAIPALAQLLVEVSTGAVSPAEARTRMAASPGLGDALRALQGKQVTADSALISFGAGSQVGDVSIGDVAGRDVIKLTLNQKIITTQGGDYADGNIDKRQGVFISLSTIQGDVIGQQTVVKVDLSRRDRDNRQRMLAQVRTFWIAGVLEQSLYQELLIALKLQTDPQAVSFTGPRLATVRAHEAQVLPLGTSIVQVYRQANQRLLILGEPGAGKTTLLLDLTRHLIDEAQLDESRPIPVILNLSSWTQRRLPLQTWLVQELRDQYGVGRRIARQWLDDNNIIPFLDGLDEVVEEQRVACVAAVNSFMQEHGTEGMVVCSRTIDYESLGVKLALDAAVLVQPLEDDQIAGYFELAGSSLAGVQAVLNQDDELRAMVRLPLLLNIISFAYYGQRPEELLGIEVSTLRQHIFDTYVRRVFEHSQYKHSQSYGPEQTSWWLHWLAARLSQDKQTIFQVEMVQPWWLQSWWQRALYVLLVTAGAAIGVGTVAVFFSVIVGFFSAIAASGQLLGMEKSLGSPPSLDVYLAELLTFWPQAGAYFGLVIGCVSGFVVSLTHCLRPRRSTLLVAVGGPVIAALLYLVWGSTKVVPTWDWTLWVFVVVPLALAIGSLVHQHAIRPMETMRWNWRSLYRRWYVGALGLPVFGLVGAFSMGSVTEGLRHFLPDLGGGLLFGLIYGLAFWIVGGISPDELDLRTRPNQGTWNALRQGLGAWALTVFACAGVLGVGFVLWGLFMAPLTWINLIGLFSSGVVFGLPFALSVGPVAGLYFGGLVFVQHFAVRLVGAFNNVMPWNYPRFLNSAVDRLFLRRVGGGYIFIHRLLMEHFAAMTDEDIERLSAEIEGARKKS